MTSLKKFEEFIKSVDYVTSQSSGKNYSSEDLKNRLSQALDDIGNGRDPESTLNYFPSGRTRKMYEAMLETELAPYTEDNPRYSYDDNRFYMKYDSSIHGRKLPYQGYKLRISATSDEARYVAKAVLPILQDLSQPHKIAGNLRRLLTLDDSQKGKFITIYPGIDSEEVFSDDNQLFTKSESKLNRKSININYNTTERILSEIINGIKESSISLRGGEKPPTDLRYKQTRVSYRYGLVMPARKTKLGEESRARYTNGEKIKDRLVNLEGYTVPDNREKENGKNGEYNWRNLSGRKELK